MRMLEVTWVVALGLVVGGAILLPLPQTLTVTLKPLTPFQITWDQPPEPDPTAKVSFRWWCEGGIVKNFTTAEVVATTPANPDGTTTYTATVPGLSGGSKSCLVSAYNDIGETKSTAIPLTVGVVPATPLKLRVVVSVGGGR